MEIFEAIGDIFGSVFGCLLFLVLGCCLLMCITGFFINSIF